MDRLYAVGETSCNGVHGKNRLASNSLLESMVFAERAADEIRQKLDTEEDKSYLDNSDRAILEVDTEKYVDDEKISAEYKELVLNEIEKEKNRHE